MSVSDQWILDKALTQWCVYNAKYYQDTLTSASFTAPMGRENV